VQTFGAAALLLLTLLAHWLACVGVFAFAARLERGARLDEP
jgi:hypothetical protein